MDLQTQMCFADWHQITNCPLYASHLASNRYPVQTMHLLYLDIVLMLVVPKLHMRNSVCSNARGAPGSDGAGRQLDNAYSQLGCTDVRRGGGG